ncbi:hypothetical protein F5887DRAFT_1079072 [Amanita rubescens]|nr:hypothetical protein F5887DRAFT_1083059 [Amanita rubescens]KAF8335670.1 hypothetical protein F5887DRAFT_1079072 [Amanita rubescens]
MSDSAFYLDRVTSGDYNRLIDNVRKMGSRALINLEYKRDFERDTRNGFKLKSNDEKIVPFTAWIFGEIAPRAVGTPHQASGNHYIGRPPHLHEDEQLEQENDQNVEAVEWLSPSNPDRAADLMCVYMGPKYVVPSSSTSTSSGTKRRGRNGKQPRIMVSAPTPVDDSTHMEPVPVVTPSVSEIKLGAHYDPRLLSDYGGALFNHSLAKLVQRNTVDEDGILTPPWLEYDKLRNGTVVLTRISKLLAEKGSYFVSVHLMTIDPSQFYQIYADRVKVLMPSLEPIDERSIRLSIDDYTTNEEGIQSDSNNNCLRGFDTVSPARDSDRTAQSSSANHLKVIDSVSPLAPGKGMLG